MSDHNAIGTRVSTRPLWTMFLLLFLTSGLYRAYWAWRVGSDLDDFSRERPGVVSAERSIRVNPAASAFFTFLLLPGAGLVLFGLLLAIAEIPAEYGIAPSSEDIAVMIGIGIACLVPGVIATLRTAGRIRAARRLAGLTPATPGTGRALAPSMLLEMLGIPASLFAMQHALNDLWSRYPSLLDEDLHGELAPPRCREAAIAERPALHEARLRRVATELEHPTRVPWVTIAFGVLCVGAFVWQLSVHGPFPATDDIEQVGGFREGLDGTWWRFWSANVLHGSVDHLAGNMFAWALVATMVERVVGHLRMALLVVVGAAGCSTGALIAHADVVSVGASGVVFASFGLAAMADPLARRPIGKLGWSMVALGVGLSTFVPGISSGGHLGGVLAGLALGCLFTVVWRVRPVDAAAHHARAEARAARLVDRSAPLAPDRELPVAERLAHLDRRHAAGALSGDEYERLRGALVARG